MKVIIFGLQDTAQLAHYYLTTDSGHEVVAFSVNESYINGMDVFCGLPVVPFEKIEEIYSPEEYAFFVPMTYRRMNNDRKAVYEAVKAKGYSCISYVNSKTTIADNVQIGENCFILEDNTIQPFVKIGNNVVIWSGNHVGHHSTIKDHVFLTRVVISGNCVIENNCFLGANSTVRDFVRMGEYTFVSLGAKIIENTEAFSVYVEQGSRKINISSLKLEN
jgi:sugar O-acyltransferase (sialic acid O-acetyltransferase NeuD family)